MCCFAVPGYISGPGRAPDALLCCAGLRLVPRKSSRCAVLLCRARFGVQEELEACCFAVPGYVSGPGRFQVCCFAVPGYIWGAERAPNVLFCCAELRFGLWKSSRCAVLLCRATFGAQEELQMCCFAVPGYVWCPGRPPSVLFCCAGLRVWGLRRVPDVLFCCAGLRLGPKKSSKSAVLLCRATFRAQEELQMCCFAVPGYVWGLVRPRDVLSFCAGLRLVTRKTSERAVLLCRATFRAQAGFQMCCFALPGYIWGPERVPSVLFCCAGLRLGPRKSSKRAVLLCRATFGAQEELQMCCFAVPGYVCLVPRKSSKRAVLLCRARFGSSEGFHMCCFAAPGQAWGPGRAANVLFCCAGPGLGPRKSFKCAVLLCRVGFGAQEGSKCAVLLCRAMFGSR